MSSADAETAPRADEDADAQVQASTSGTANLLRASSTILGLLTRQQTEGQDGIRLQIHNCVAENIVFGPDCEYPYHFCALTGNVALAMFLYLHGVPCSQVIRIASFRSGGMSGSTPWHNRIRLPPDDVAMLAGDAQVAEVLDLIAWQTPLTWHRGNACTEDVWPPILQEKARPIREAMFRAPWYLALPGPARQLIMQELMGSLVREHVWHAVEQPVWEQQWAEVLGEPLLSSARKLAAKHACEEACTAGSDKEDEEEAHFPPYQIRITCSSPQPSPARAIHHWHLDRAAICKCLQRGSAGVLALDTAVKFGMRLVPLKVATFGLGLAFPYPAIIAAAYLAPRTRLRDLLFR